MRLRIELLLTLLLLFCCAGCSAPGEAVSPRDPDPLPRPLRVLLLGDSISMGYTPHVQAALEGEAVVHRPRNAAGTRPANCQGTDFGIEHVDEWLAIDGGGWDVIHFNFGLHDLKRVDPLTGKNSNDPDDPHQSSPEDYERQLRAIVARLAATDARLVLATTTPVPEGGVRPHREPSDVPRYNAIAARIAAEYAIPVNDLYAFALPRMAEIGRPADVHFTPAGSEALGGQVVQTIRDRAGW